MNNKLFVGGVSRNTSEQSLREAFEQAGNVTSVWIKINREDGLPAGFGFVEFASEDEANAAIDMWNGKEFDGRTLTVNVAKPKVDHGSRDRNFSGGGYQNRGGRNRY